MNFDDNADTHQVVMAPERAQIQEWFPVNAERIERSLDWLLGNDLLLRPRKPLRAVRLDWRDLAQCMGDDSLQPQCDFSDNQYLLVAMVVLLCVRFRCNDPQRMVVILQCELARWGATRYQQWRRQLMLWQRHLVRYQKDGRPRERIMILLRLRNDNISGTCAALLDSENICINETPPKQLCWCSLHAPPLVEHAPSTVVMHSLRGPVRVAGYFEDRWAARGNGWNCSYIQFHRQVEAYKERKERANYRERGWCTLRFVNVSVDQMEHIIRDIVAPRLSDVLTMGYLMVDFLQSDSQAKSFVRYYDLKRFKWEEFIDEPPTPETEQADVRKSVTQGDITQLEESLDLGGQAYVSADILQVAKWKSLDGRTRY